jgi:hypothetical protein
LKPVRIKAICFQCWETADDADAADFRGSTE